MRRGPKTDVDRNLAILAAYNSGKKIGCVADEYGVTRQRVYQIVRQTAERHGLTLRRKKPPKGVRRRHVPTSIIAAVREGKLKVAAAARVVGCSIGTIELRVGVNVRAVQKQRTLDRYRVLYERFMRGATLAELAYELGISVGCVEQCLIRYRKATGEPCKPEYQGRQQVAS